MTRASCHILDEKQRKHAKIIRFTTKECKEQRKKMCERNRKRDGCVS